MLDKEYYTKLFFNEETGKERYGLIPKEAESIYKTNSLEKCWDIAMECYNCELYYIQMMAVYIMGLISHKNKTALNFLKNTVSENPSWQVQEFLAMAFDNYCKDNGYENSLATINEWLNNKNKNVRRAVTEGLRSWIKRPYFEDNPQEAIRILTDYKTDESEYVRKSVGNALKDISKKFPELINAEIKNWKLDTKEIKQVSKLATKLFK
ncbi:MAG: DNA alkylation repair protein [Treponemataceae bacterium]|nr:MAG: DNA alkylation repair protein [Treponemataceae bacterium]